MKGLSSMYTLKSLIKERDAREIIKTSTTIDGI